jgi:hypothetical protein
VPASVLVRQFSGDEPGTPLFTLRFNPQLEKFDQVLHAKAHAAMQLPPSDTREIFDHRNPR